jgi:small subunit ribosomal protein S1
MSDIQLETIEQNQTPDSTEETLTPKRKMQFSGRVVRLTLAGAIVDIGLEKPAVLHISRMRNEPLNRVEDFLHVGDTIDVWVQRIDPKSDLVELTMIKPLELEWREIKPGMTVKGQVVRLEKFGAFIEIGAERPGLVHVSEITNGYIREPAEVLKTGEEVEASVIGVDRRKKRIQLSMKALEAVPEKPARSDRSRGTKDEQTEIEVEEVVPTAMEFAIRQAMEQNKGDADTNSEKQQSVKKQNELEEILSRTLEQEVKA